MAGISTISSYGSMYSGGMQGSSGVYGRADKTAGNPNGKKRSIVSEPDKASSAKELKNQSINESLEMRKMIRDLHRSNAKDLKNEATKPKSLIEESLESDEKEEEKVQAPVNYNYKEVSNKIQRAKTSVSAGQAFLAAKRKVLDVQRKIAAKEGDPEELQMALTHAKRMELVARKKKNHLELEELADRTIRSDEQRDKMEETEDSIRNAMISKEEEKLGKKEDEIFESRKEQIEQAAKEMQQSSGNSSEDMLADLNEMISKFGEEELKQLEEAMEMLEDMEMLDPHMTEDELKELKLKHRMAESKAMLKADMDYLKGMIKHQTGKEAMLTGIGPGSGTAVSFEAASFAVSAGAEAAPTAEVSAAPSFDIQV